jgi:hypothetical protein
MTWELGWMRNLGERHAVGGTTFIEGDGLRMAGWRVGLKARYRWWLEGNRSVDVAPGVILYGEEDFTPDNPGALLAVGYNLGDVVSFTAQAEVLQYPSKTLRTGGYVGVRLGSYPGIIAAALALLAGALVIPPVTAAF